MNAVEVFMVFLRLGLTSFGGPVAHIGYFHKELIQRRRWLDEHAYAELVALCQALPGPSSSQVGIAMGLHRAGVGGAVAAWLGFTLPSALIMIAFALGIASFSGPLGAGLLHGLKLVAVPVVAQALWSMGRKHCVGLNRLVVAGGGACLAIFLPFAFGQLLVLALGTLIGYVWLKDSESLPHVPLKTSFSRRTAALILSLFAVLLFVTPLAAQLTESQALKLFASFFRAGSLVFGGGHVVLPMLQAAVVTPGWVSASSFMAGYGAAQAIPGPLFTFTAYLGAVSQVPPAGVWGALICLIAAFLPSFFLLFGTLPFWEQIRSYKKMRSTIQGINAAVVGILLAAFYSPVWTSAVHSWRDVVFACAGFALLVLTRVPSWAVVLMTALLCGIVA